MKAAKGAIFRSVDQPDPKVRLYLFHGADQSQSRGLADRLLAGLGASRHVIASGAIRSDAALLADEAGAISLFGERRLLWIEPAGEEIIAAAEALLTSPAAESAVVAIAGTLRKTSALLKLAEAHPLALAHVSYVPEGAQAERMVSDVGRTLGLRIAPPLAARIAEAAGNDQAIAVQELKKFALYLGASPESPKELDQDTVDLLGADVPEGEFLQLADLSLQGDLRTLADALGTLASGGTESVPALRAMQRRLLMLAPMRAKVDSGRRLQDVMASAGKSLFWKDKALVEELLSRWDAAGLARVAERIGKLERDSMLAASPPNEALGEELMAVARSARRR